MADYGNRNLGGKKSKGYFGELPSSDGASISTELSVGFDYGDGEVEVPLLNPMMTKPEIEMLLSGKEPTKDMIEKTAKFGQARIRAGLPTFALPEEEGTFKVPAE